MTTTIIIERIEIVPAIAGLRADSCVMASRGVLDDGKFRYIEPINLLVGDIDATGLPHAVQDAIAAINTQLQSQLNQLTTDLAAANTAKNEAIQAKEQAESQISTLQARIAELEAQLNPPNPFPNADWQGFRSAALASPIVLRMAMSNMGNFMMLLIYMTEMQKDPAAVAKMAGVWNEMEGKTPLSSEEIAAINALAQAHSVPMVLNSEGQIVLP